MAPHTSNLWTLLYFSSAVELSWWYPTHTTAFCIFPSSRSVPVDDLNNKMPSSSKLHGPGTRRVTLRWTPYMRLTLHIMSTDFGLSPYSEKARKVFEVIFNQHIRDCGLNACPTKALGIQYHERNYAIRSHLWSKILHPRSTPQEAALRRELRQSIADAIQQVDSGIQSGGSIQSHAPVIASRTKSTPSPSPSPTTRNGGRRRELAMVLIPTSKAVTATAPKSPPSPPKTPKITSPYHRRYGPVLNLTDRALARIPDEWTPPTTDKVHLKSLPAIFFRFWSEDQTYCLNSKDCFIAGKYIKSNVVPRRAPTIDQLDPTDIVNHVEGLKIATPFISVSASYIWSCKNALKENKKGRKLMVSVIDASALDFRSVFYTRTLIKSVRSFLPFTGMKWLYYGSDEFFIWHEIPRRAILSCYALDDFLKMVNNSHGIAVLIQPTLLQRTADQKLRNVLKNSACEMSEVVATSCANLMQYMGLTATSNVEHVQALVAQFVAGWAIKVPHLTPHQWADLASIFAHAFSIRELRPLSLCDMQALKMSFLLGVCGGLKDIADKDLAAQMSPAALKKLRQRVVDAGLENSAAILRGALEHELNGASNQLMIQQRSYERKYLPAPSQMLLQDEVDVDEDSFDDADDGMDVYEFDFNGLVV